MPEKCYVHGCDKPVVAKGVCQKHYMRLFRRGNVDESRPVDWGQREKHSAFKTWCGLRRYHRLNTQKSWLDNFWNFVKDIPEKPENSRAHRPDPSKPWGVDNFYWKERRALNRNKKEYARQWAKNARKANADYYFDQDLKRKYKVSLDWYQKTLSEQSNVCAICKQTEALKIRGKIVLMAVDHCHKTGIVRGLLCSNCNRAIGLFKDDVNVLKNAIKYLNAYSETA